MASTEAAELESLRISDEGCAKNMIASPSQISFLALSLSFLLPPHFCFFLCSSNSFFFFSVVVVEIIPETVFVEKKKWWRIFAAVSLSNFPPSSLSRPLPSFPPAMQISSMSQAERGGEGKEETLSKSQRRNTHCGQATLRERERERMKLRPLLSAHKRARKGGRERGGKREKYYPTRTFFFLPVKGHKLRKRAQAPISQSLFLTSPPPSLHHAPPPEFSSHFSHMSEITRRTLSAPPLSSSFFPFLDHRTDPLPPHLQKVLPATHAQRKTHQKGRRRRDNQIKLPSSLPSPPILHSRLALVSRSQDKRIPRTQHFLSLPFPPPSHR